MSDNYVDQIPRENLAAGQAIKEIKFNDCLTQEEMVVQCDTTGLPSLLHAASEDTWMGAFEQHYRLLHEVVSPESVQSSRSDTGPYMAISAPIYVMFSLDFSKYTMTFRYLSSQSSQAREVIDTFVDRIWFGQPQRWETLEK